MSSRSAEQRYSTEVDQIENMADTKGVEIEEIEVEESTTDEGDQLVSFRVYSEAGPKVQITKMPNVQTANVTFRDDVQNKLSALKRHISGTDQEEPPAPDESDGNGESDADGTRTQTQSSRTRARSTGGDGPGAQLDAEIEAIHDRLDELEARIDDLEDKSEALDGLQQLMQGNGSGGDD